MRFFFLSKEYIAGNIKQNILACACYHIYNNVIALKLKLNERRRKHIQSLVLVRTLSCYNKGRFAKS